MRTIACSELGARGRDWWLILAMVMALAPEALAQGMGGSMPLGMPTMLGEPGGNGFGFYGVAAYAEYTSTTIPFNSTLPIPGLDLGPNYLAGGSARVGWSDMGAQTDAHVTYTISYNASIRYSKWNSLNHYLNFGVLHEVTPRLIFNFSGSAATMRWDQFLFEPTILSEVAGVPSTFDELVSAILSGKYSNSQLASILTGAPLLDSPAATLLYGTRFFTSSLKTGLSYDISARLRFHAGVGGTRVQHLHSDSTEFNGVYLVPSVTTANAGVGVDYSLSPLTTVGFEAQGSRTVSRFENAYSANGLFTGTRVLGRHWIVSGRGGAGTYLPAKQTFKFKPGLHYLASGGLTYKAYTQTVMLNYSHAILDTSGIGAESSDSASGVWLLHYPGQRWAIFAQGRYSRLEGSTLSNINAWLAGGGLERVLNRHTNMTLAYVYGRDSGVVEGALVHQPFQAVNLVVFWSPHPMAY